MIVPWRLIEILALSVLAGAYTALLIITIAVKIYYHKENKS